MACLALTGMYDFKLNIDMWVIIHAIQVMRIVTITNKIIAPNFRHFLNDGLGYFIFMFQIDFLPYDLVLNSKPISYAFDQFHLVSEYFLIIFLAAISVFIVLVGAFILLLAAFECLRPTGKSKRCQWAHKYMRICVEYITFNTFLRWFHELSLTLYISCLFNIRVNPFFNVHWSRIVSYIFCFVFLILNFAYWAWIVYYFRKSRRPVTLDLPVGAIKRR